MKSPNSPKILEPLDIVAVNSEFRDEQNTQDIEGQQVATKLAEQDALAIELGAAREVTKLSQREKTYVHIGNVAMGRVPDEKKNPEEYRSYVEEFGNDKGKLPKAKRGHERRYKNKVDRKVAKYKRSAAIRSVVSPTIPKDRNNNQEKPSKLANNARKLGLTLNFNLDSNQRKSLKNQLDIDPILIPTRLQKKVNSKDTRAKRKLDQVLNEPTTKRDEAVARATEAYKTRQAAKVRGELLEIKKVTSEAEVAANKAKREYNDKALEANRSRKEHAKRKNHNVKIKRSIKRLERGQAKRAGGTGIQGVVSNAANRLKLGGAVKAYETRVTNRLTGKRTTLAENKVKAKTAKQEYKSARKEARALATVKEAAEQNILDVKKYFEDLATNNLITFDDAIKALSFADSELSDNKKAEAELHTRNHSEHGRDYARTLVELVAKHGIEPKIQSMTEEALKDVRERLEDLGLEPSKYGKNPSWFLWDLAKQTYMAKNPGQSGPEYAVSDPMTDPNMVEEIIDRQIGWEIYRSFSKLSEADRQSFIMFNNITPEVTALLELPPKENGTLTADQLAEIGYQVG